MESVGDEEKGREMKLKIMTEAGLATANIQDALQLLTSIFKFVAISQIE